MDAAWQDVAALGLVIVAGGYLARRLYLFIRRRTAGCGSCAACPADADPKEKSMVSVESLIETAVEEDEGRLTVGPAGHARRASSDARGPMGTAVKRDG